MKSSLVKVFWKHAMSQPCDIKDPSLVPMPDGTYIMYASILGGDIPDGENIGRFHASHPGGPYHQLENAYVHGITGWEACAPQVLLDEKDGQRLWTMFVQTCFSKPDSVIIEAVSTNGIDFYPLPEPAITKNSIPDASVVSVYDVSVANIHYEGKPQECMILSGYRHVGCGDLYASLREKGSLTKAWSAARLTQKQEDIPFHNKPGASNFEWGLEGGKIHQLDENSFLQIGVCFLDKDVKLFGTRQRVFFSHSKTPFGPFESHSLPIEPTVYNIGQGENGHPDVIDLDGKLAIVYQERISAKHPWHLRYLELTRDDLNHIFAKPVAP